MIKGHNSKFDDLGADVSEDERVKEADAVDIRKITIDRVGVNRKQASADDSEESLHDYEFVIG